MGEGVRRRIAREFFIIFGLRCSNSVETLNYTKN